MKSLPFFILFSFIVNVCLFSQTDINPNGYNTFYYPNGSIQSEGNLKNGQPEGYWINYYPTGVIKSEGSRKNHQLDSIWVFYTIAGDTASKLTYLNGKKNGYCYEYYSKTDKPENVGNLKSKELYVNNLREQIGEYYYENGNIKQRVAYKLNKKDGRGIEYALDGRIVTIYNYRKGTITEREKLNRYSKNGVKEGLWREYYDSYKMKKEEYYKDGLLHGYYKEYSGNGKLLLTHLYRNGELVETVDDDNIESNDIVEYYPDGSIKSVGGFVKDKPVGIHKSYSVDGEKIVAKIYNDNSELIFSGYVDSNNYRLGVWQEFYRHGKVKAKGKYLRNRRHGTWEFYFEDGKMEQVGEYDRGKYNGIWIWYYTNGNVWKEEEYYNGRPEGHYVEYDEEGNLLVEGDYYDGEREGEWITQINDHKAVGKYASGFMDGKWKHYYDNENVSYEGMYIQGYPNGKHKYYYPEGKLKEERYYNMGVRHKNWKKFSEDGELVLTITYKNDIEYRINGVKVEFPNEIPKVID